MDNKLVIFTAPSGAGKTTLVKHLVSRVSSLAFSVSVTTRQQRKNEVHGRDYYFISHQEFKQKIANGDLLEWQEVYDGNYYGTLRSEIDRLWQAGKHVIFDVDVQGAINIKNCYGRRALTVFVKPPSVQTLRDRLIGRNSETNETLERRLKKAVKELAYENQFDTAVLNDNLTIAKEEAFNKVTDFLKQPTKALQFANYISIEAC